MEIQSYTLSHNNHKQVPSRQVPLHKREDDERVWLRWNNQMTRKLFHITNSSVIFGCLVGLVCITNATVILGCLVYLVCHQPSSPSYLVVWFVLFAINQFHHHIWLFSVFPTGMNTSVQVYLKQCWPLMLSSSVGSSGSL